MTTHPTNNFHKLELENANLRAELHNPKVVQFMIHEETDLVLYSNILVFTRDNGSKWYEQNLLHDQEDLKHLFQGDK